MWVFIIPGNQENIGDAVVLLQHDGSFFRFKRGSSQSITETHVERITLQLVLDET